MYQPSDMQQAIRFELRMLLHPAYIEWRWMRQHQSRLSTQLLIVKYELLKASFGKQLLCGHCPDDDIQLIIHRVKLTHKPGSGTDSGRLFISLFPLSRIAVSHGSDIEVMLIIKLCIIDLIPFPAQLFPTGVMEGRPLLCT